MKNIGFLHLLGMNKLLYLVFSLAFVACQSKREPTDLATQEVAQLRTAAPEQASPKADPDLSANDPVQLLKTANRKVIRNAQLRIRVSDFILSGRSIEQSAKQVGGQITNSNETKSDNTIENALTIRVPADQLDSFIDLVLKEAIFTDVKTITAEDVTRRYVDVEARIRSKKAVEETYLQLLKKAHSVDDVLKIEEQLGQIREDREVQEAELRQLKEDVAFSTVTLTYYQVTKGAMRPQEPFYARIATNFSDGLSLLTNVLIGAFYLLPLGLVVAGVIWLVARWRRQKAV